MSVVVTGFSKDESTRSPALFKAVSATDVLVVTKSTNLRTAILKNT